MSSTELTQVTMATTTPQSQTSKPKKAAGSKSAQVNHPTYLEMIKAAIQSLKERSGSSRQAILKYIIANYNVGNDAKAVNVHLKQALKRGVASGALKNAKGGTGASGSFRLSSEKKVAAKKPASPKTSTTEKKASVSSIKKAAVKKTKTESTAKKAKKATAAKKGGATGAAAVKAPKSKKTTANKSPAKKVPAKAASKKPVPAAPKAAAKKATASRK